MSRWCPERRFSRRSGSACRMRRPLAGVMEGVRRIIAARISHRSPPRSLQQRDESRVFLDTLGDTPQADFAFGPPEYRVKIAVQLEPPSGSPAKVEYTLGRRTPRSCRRRSRLAPPGQGMSGSVGLEGSDGSWLILDVGGGQHQRRRDRRLAGRSSAARRSSRRRKSRMRMCVVPARRSQPDIASMEMDTPADGGSRPNAPQLSLPARQAATCPDHTSRPRPASRHRREEPDCQVSGC